MAYFITALFWLFLAFLGYWFYEHNDIYIAVAFVSFLASTYFTWRKDKLESDPWSSESALSNVRICRDIGMLVFALSFLVSGFTLQSRHNNAMHATSA